jgi:hypothetical protein
LRAAPIDETVRVQNTGLESIDLWGDRLNVQKS